MKVCTKCHIEKDDREFKPYRKKNRKETLFCWCKDCEKDYMTIYRVKNKAQLKLYEKNYRDKNADVIRERYKISGLKHGRKRRDEITNSYIKQLLIYKHGFSKKQIEENPEIIEIKRLQIKTIRLLKSKQNDNKN